MQQFHICLSLMGYNLQEFKISWPNLHRHAWDPGQGELPHQNYGSGQNATIFVDNRYDSITVVNHGSITLKTHE